MKFTSNILLITLVCLTTSCKKYLGDKPDQSLAVPHTLADLQALLDYSTVMNQQTPVWDEASSDNYFLSISTYNTMSTGSQLAYNWQNAAYSNFPNDWSYLYNAVLYANTVLDNIGNVGQAPQNPDSWNNVKGSALFFRSAMFLKALFLFSKAYDSSSAATDFGIVLRMTSDFNAPSVRSSVKDGYGQVIQDLKAAALLLPSAASVAMRPSKAAAYGMLSRAYLSMRQYDSAYKYAGACLQLNSQLLNYNTFSTTGTATVFALFNPEVIFHASVIYSYSCVSPTNARIDTMLYNSYSANDLRKALFFTPKTDGFSFRGTYSGTTTSLFTGIARDEIYLTEAECAARLGKTDEAMTLLNTLLATRWKTGTYSPLTAGSPATALATVLTERRKEVVFRGLRWMDVKRLNKEGANISMVRVLNGQQYALPPNDNRYALLLPSDIVNIAGIQQNPQ